MTGAVRLRSPAGCRNTLLLPLLYALGLMQWEDISFGWALFAVYGAAQVALTYAVCVPLERWRPVERWPDARAVTVDILYTLISRVGLLPLVTFVLFYKVQVALNGLLADQGWVPPTLERLFPFLLGQPVLTFCIYVVILDFADYWRHRLSHVFDWWYSLHALHHAQRQMTFWSDDRNHLLDEIIAFVWFTAVALLIGIPPMQFPLLVLLLRLLESLSHANARLSFGWLGERLLVSPRFHRAHHGTTAAGRRERELRRDPALVGHAVPHRRFFAATMRAPATRPPRRRWPPAATRRSNGPGCGGCSGPRTMP